MLRRACRDLVERRLRVLGPQHSTRQKSGVSRTMLVSREQDKLATLNGRSHNQLAS